MTPSTRATEQQDPQQRHRASRKPQAAPAGGSGAQLQRLPDNPAAASSADVSQLQARYGNRAVTRLLASHTVQAKLQVGPANDSYEQEADRVSRQVMRMPETKSGAKDDDEEKS